MFLLIFRYYRKTKQCCRKRFADDSSVLLKKIRQNSLFNWRLLVNIQYEDYIWWSYPSIRQNEVFNLINRQICFKRNNGVPKGIMLIVEFVNKSSYFNKKIKHFLSILSWTTEIFLYYHRFYRMLSNERQFGKKNFLSCKNGHKLHFISYLKHRELTGCRLNTNHMLFCPLYCNFYS